MKVRIVIPAVAFATVLMQAVLAEPSRAEQGMALTALEQKLVGAWAGQSGCAGAYLFRADGTYQLTGYGPAPYDSAGTWKVRCETRPATLVLTCRESDLADEVGKSLELRFIRLDAYRLAVERGKQDPERYARAKE
jgi:hypothetical protein